MSKKNEYAKALVNAYSDGLLKIVWNTSGFSLGVDPQKKDLLPELKEKEFVEYVFSIVKIIAHLAEDKDLLSFLESLNLLQSLSGFLHFYNL